MDKRRKESVDFDREMVLFYENYAENRIVPAMESFLNLKSIVELDAKASETSVIRGEMVKHITSKVVHLKDSMIESMRKNSDNALVAYDYLHYSLTLNCYDEMYVIWKKLLSSQVEQFCNRNCLLELKKAKQNESNFVKGYVNRQIHISYLNKICTKCCDHIEMIEASSVIDKQELYTIVVDIAAEYIEKVMEIYATDARIENWEKKTTKDAFESEESIQTMDLVLDEISVLLQMLVQYLQYTDGFHAAQTKLTQMVAERQHTYMVLERYYFNQTVRKGIEIAEPFVIEGEQIVGSSAVEDVWFLVNKIFQRAMLTNAFTTILSIVLAIAEHIETMYTESILHLPENLVKILRSQLVDEEQKRHRTASMEQEEQPLSSLTDAFLLALDEDLVAAREKEVKIIVGVNSALLSIKHLEQFKSQLLLMEQQERILQCLPTSFQQLHDNFDSIQNNGIHVLVQQAKLQSNLEEWIIVEFKNTNFHIENSKEYDIRQGNTSFGFIDKMNKHESFLRLKNQLCQEAWHTMLKVICDHVVQQIQQCLVPSNENNIAIVESVSELGALQLESQIRQLLTDFSHHVGSHSRETYLRPCFSALDNIVLVLNILEPKNIIPYYQDIQQTMSLNELDYCLRLRTTFNAAAIAQTISKLQS